MSDLPILQNFVNRIFRCRHRRRSFPLTPRGENQCYAVCLDCGQRLGSDLQVIDRIQTTGTRSGESSNRGKESGDLRASTSGRDAPKQKETAVRDTPRVRTRARKYELMSMAIFVIGFSAGHLYFSAKIPGSRSNAGPPSRIQPSISVLPARSVQSKGGSTDLLSARNVADTRLNPIISSEPKPATTKTKSTRVAPPGSDATGGSNGTLQLKGKSSLVLLGLEAAVIHDLSQHPDRLPELIQSGLLFTAPRGTAIHLREREDGVVKVLIVEGSMAGREGWVRASQVGARDKFSD